MKIDSLHYCWVIGNTGFRESALYEKIESYLLILEEFKRRKYVWSNNQREFFDLMREFGFMEKGSNSEVNAPKAARLKTSPLEKLGLVTQDRNITEMGKVILDRAKMRISNKKIFDEEHFLENDGDIYIKQLIKLHFFANNKQGIRPFILFLEYLQEFKYLTYSEMAYILPLIVCKELKEYGKSLIYKYREEKTHYGFDEFSWIKTHIINHKDKICEIYNIKRYIEDTFNALENSLRKNEKEKIEEFIIKIDANGKSKNYSLKLYDLFIALYNLWKHINNFELSKKNIHLVINGINKTSSTQQKEWRKLILGITNKSVLKNINDKKYKSYIDHFKRNFYDEDFKKFIFNFFDSLWYIKILNNLDDYADHNIRYLKLSNILERIYIDGEKALKTNEFYTVLVDKILEDDNIQEVYFNQEEYKNYLYNNTYSLPVMKEEDMDFIAINLINEIESISKEKVSSKKPSELNYRQWINSLKDKYVEKRIVIMIENTRQAIIDRDEENILNCLNLIEKRRDIKLKELIDTEADVPTIFEYLVWQSFLLLGCYTENPIKFANFSLDNDLKPVQHAGGGMADVIFRYEDHHLILEATLTSEENQRKLEMEPVPRHLAKYRYEINNNSYCIFIAPNIDPNVAVVYRAFKKYPYYVKDKNDKTFKDVRELLILPISVNELKAVLMYSIKNDVLYDEIKEKIFSNLLNSETLDGYLWYLHEIKPKIALLKDVKSFYVSKNEIGDLVAEKKGF